MSASLYSTCTLHYTHLSQHPVYACQPVQHLREQQHVQLLVLTLVTLEFLSDQLLHRPGAGRGAGAGMQLGSRQAVTQLR